MNNDNLLEIYHAEEIKVLLDLIPVKAFCELCNISRVYYYKIIKDMTRYEIYKKYCN